MARGMVIEAGAFPNVPSNAEVPAAIAMSQVIAPLERAKSGIARWCFYER